MRRAKLTLPRISLLAVLLGVTPAAAQTSPPASDPADADADADADASAAGAPGPDGAADAPPPTLPPPEPTPATAASPAAGSPPSQGSVVTTSSPPPSSAGSSASSSSGGSRDIPPPLPEGDVAEGGSTVGLVIAIIGGIGIAAGSAMIIIDSTTAEEEQAPAFDPLGGNSGVGRPEETAGSASTEDDDPFTVTDVGAIVFVASAAVMAIGGWIYWDWTEPESDDTAVRVVPYVAPQGAGFVGTF